MMEIKVGILEKLSAAILLTDSATNQPAIGAFLFFFNDKNYAQVYQSADGYYVFIEPKPGSYKLKVCNASQPNVPLVNTLIKIPDEPNDSNAVFNYQITL